VKISKKDLQLLVLLGLVAIGALYYWLLYQPQMKALQALRDEKAMLMQQHTEIIQKFSIEASLDKDIEASQVRLLGASERYYGELYQESLVMTIEELSRDTKFEIKGITFTKEAALLNQLAESINRSVEPTSQVPVESTTSAESVPSTPTPSVVEPQQTTETYVNTITALIQFEGYYTDIESFMFNLYKYPKQMVIQSLNITSDLDGLLTGIMAIEFHGMPKIALASENLQTYFENKSKRSAVTDVFLPYETFVLPEVPEDDNALVEESTEDLPEIPAELIPIEVPNEIVSSFEDFDFFFTGDNVNIVGSASRSVVRTDGNYGLKVQYNFVEPRKINTANVVFDQQPLVVTDVGKSLAINAYSERALKHRVGAELIDALGKTYQVTFAMGLEASGWQTLETAIPDSINYPFVVKRLIFEGTGLSQQLVAEVILDELRVMLPDLGGSQ